VPRLLHYATILNLPQRHIAIMKIPEGLLTAQGKKAAGAVYILGTDGQYLREYGTAQDGIYSTCLVLTSPGDMITGSFALEPGLADHVDLVVDGIRRESSSSSGSDKSFNRMYKRACYQEKKDNRTGGLKSCAMMIQTRKADEGEIGCRYCAVDLISSRYALDWRRASIYSWDPGDSAIPAERSRNSNRNC
jgi:hypothetical protein